jgi:hypothetical protein
MIVGLSVREPWATSALSSDGCFSDDEIDIILFNAHLINAIIRWHWPLARLEEGCAPKPGYDAAVLMDEPIKSG